MLAGGFMPKFAEKMTQLGSHGGGNHFGECETVEVLPGKCAQSAADVFGLSDGCTAFLSHCGARLRTPFGEGTISGA